jgi:hypothetical protein
VLDACSDPSAGPPASGFGEQRLIENVATVSDLPFGGTVPLASLVALPWFGVRLRMIR